MPFRFATIYTSNRKSLICALRCFKGRSLHRKSDKTQLKPMWGHSREWSERRGVKGKKMRERERMLFGSFEGKQKAMMRCRWGRASLAHYSSTANHNGESPWFLITTKENLCLSIYLCSVGASSPRKSSVIVKCHALSVLLYSFNQESSWL